MKILLDTHILLWQMMDDERLRSRDREIIVDPKNDLTVSDVSLWEISIKIQTGRLAVKLPDVESTIATLRYSRLAISRAHIAEVVKLPRYHRDPFDHLLIAQANLEGLAFMTHDRKIGQYPVRLVK
jgi:PIN domain nuclease of toxin-antitoxin system